MKLYLNIALAFFLVFAEWGFQDNAWGVERAVSLKALQHNLKKTRKDSKSYQLLQRLCGLTRIDGYLIDEENADIILWGRAEPSDLPLFTEDFVVALRNVWFRYAKTEGNTIIYSNPGCSIDPDKDVIKRLDVIWEQYKSEDNSNLASEDKILSQWAEKCKESQAVSIMGIPPTRFAKVLIEADYRMKDIVDGNARLDVNCYQNMKELIFKDIEADIKEGRNPSLNFSPMNRFEFCAGPNEYVVDNDLLKIERCDVNLETEAEFLATEGLKGTGMAGPYAMKIAESFTKCYDQIAAEIPIYADLKNLFRFVVLSKIMKYRNVDEIVDINFLVESYPVSLITIGPELPGKPDMKKREFSRGAYTYTFWLPSCGGVNMNIDVTSSDFIGPKSEQLTTMGKTKYAVLSDRPSKEALFWDYASLSETHPPVTPAVIRSNEIEFPAKSPGILPKRERPERVPPETDAEAKGEGSPFLIEREQNNLAAASEIGNCLIFDYFLDSDGKAYIHTVRTGGVVDTFSADAARKYQRLIDQTLNLSGPIDDLIPKWEKFYKDHLAEFAEEQKVPLSFGGNRYISIKPLLIIKSNIDNPNLTRLESIPVLRDNFILFFSMKPDKGNAPAADDLVKRITNAPVLTRENAMFIIRPPKEGMTSEQQEQWSQLIHGLKGLVGEENVVFNPDKDKFVDSFKDKGKEIVIIEITHTKDGIVLSNEDVFKTVDIDQLGDLSHIKYLWGGNSCSLPKIDGGKLISALRDNGVGIINASYSTVSMSTVLKRLEILTQILKNTELFKMPVYYLPDIIDQSTQIKDGEKGTSHWGALSPWMRIIIWAAA